MKKTLAIVLAAVMLLSLFSGCGGKVESSYFGDKANANTLRICLDTSVNYEETVDREFYERFINEVKSASGMEKVSIELVPSAGAERETVLQRLRTEIMAGEGPDVFLMAVSPIYSEHGNKYALFNFPEKNMEAGIFLPLDEYMENNTQFTNWDAQTEVILNAGRGDEGQVIIPLTYTFPVLVYPKEDANIPYTTDLTMQEILDDPETAEIGAVMYAARHRDLTEFTEFHTDTSTLTYLLGQHADYKSEKLCFTEDEMYETVQTVHGLRDAVESNARQYIRSSFGEAVLSDMNRHFLNAAVPKEMSIVPVYAKDGGVTASVTAFAAVNRNTKFPEAAFTVIDLIMQEKSQMSTEYVSWYSRFLSSDIPLQNDLGTAEKKLPGNISLQPEHYEELMLIKEQITAVNFETELGEVLGELGSAYFFAHEKNQPFTRETAIQYYEKMEKMMGE